MAKESKVTFLVWSVKESTLGKYMQQDGADIRSVYYGAGSKVINVLRMLWFKFKLPKKIWFDKSLKDIKGIIVVFDAMIVEECLKWIIESNPEAKVIFLYWNPIKISKPDIAAVKNMKCEIWSYGQEQCSIYNVKQNAPFYCKSMYKSAQKYAKQDKEYDIIFCGRDRGRLEYINSLMTQKYWKDLKWNLYISPDHFWLIFKNKIYKMFLPYDKILCRQVKSKAVLELVPFGLKEKETTMRTIDALYMKQKLITNNTNVINLDYYDKNNIFVIGVDNERELKRFLDMPFQPVSEEVWKELSLEKWTERFVNDEPLNKIK